MTARSTRFGSAAADGRQAMPSSSAACGFTGYTGPPKPPAMMFAKMTRPTAPRRPASRR